MALNRHGLAGQELLPHIVQTMKFITVFFLMTRAILFYPFMIGLFLWLYIRDAHWIFGTTVIGAILILDPIWRILAVNTVKTLRNKHK